MPRFGASPSCARCSRAVYAAESAVGPLGRAYHKACLACVVCARRLDSTLLVEHEGEAYCRNCHRAHLGQGKGGFGLAVPLQPVVPTRSEKATPTKAPAAAAPRVAEERGSLERSSLDSASRYAEPPAAAAAASPRAAASSQRPVAPAASSDADFDDETLDLAAQVSQINVSARPSVRSIDDAVSSNAPLPAPISRLAAARARGAGPGHPASPPKPSVAVMERPASPPKPSSAPLARERVRTPSPEPQAAAPAPAFSPPQPARPRSPLASGARTIGSVAVPASPESSSYTPVRSTHSSVPAPSFSSPSSAATESPNMRITRVPATLSNVASLNSAALPAPARQTPRGANGGSGVKTAPSWTPPPASQAAREFEPPGRGVRATGLGSSVRGTGGTPLCARCAKAVYFAEQLQAAGRAWHRFCLRCDGCNTTLEPGKLEEGPLEQAQKSTSGCNVWCRTCYAKRFGPKGIGVGGISLPEHQ